MAQISLRIEDDVKKKAEQVCADIGMSLSTAGRLSLRGNTRLGYSTFGVGLHERRLFEQTSLFI